MRPIFLGKPNALALLVLCLLAIQCSTQAQMRKVYAGASTFSYINNTSFYTPAEGYVATNKWLSYTTDSGRTMNQIWITTSNVDYGPYNPNITFGFGIYGVKAFDKQNLIVYGDYGLVPAILRSSDGGTSFKLVYHSQFNSMQLSSGVTDVVFPGNGNTGYAVDADRVLKTTDKGLTWTVAATAAGSFFKEVQAIDAANVFAISNDYRGNKILKTTNGTTWSAITLPVLPGADLAAAHFLTSATGWVNMKETYKGYIYKTTNGGASWVLVNDPVYTSFSGYKMKFTDVNTGYALSGTFTIYKTVNGGAVWEPLPRDNDFISYGTTHNCLDFFSPTQFWAGGGQTLLELTTNSGGTPIPKAKFYIDTLGLVNTGNINLRNVSRTDYTYRWLINGKEVGTAYNHTYQRDPQRMKDTIRLIVSNGTTKDTATQYQQFHPPVIVTTFNPNVAGEGDEVMIIGENFSNPVQVWFGGVLATQAQATSTTRIMAKVGAGATGDITVVTSRGRGKISGFVFYPPPVITGFTPQAAAVGATVTITGTEFTNVRNVKFAGIPATSWQLVSPGVIEAVVPSGGDGEITVQTPGGTGARAGFVAVPVVKNFTPLKGTQGTIMTITGTSFTGITSVSIGGAEVLNFKIDSANGITALVGPGSSGDVKVGKATANASLPGFSWFAAPVITSFAPLSGPVGTVVTITGSGFHPTPANNKVRFGGMLAKVTAATSTTLTVQVPAGASFEPISVTTNYLVGYSALSFAVTFAGGSITPNSFTKPDTVWKWANPADYFMEQADMDDDGKADIINAGNKIFRNTTTGSTITFDGYYFGQATNASGEFYRTDLDGDGRIDYVVMAYDSIVINRNTTVNKNISFEHFTFVRKGSSEFGLLSDFDGDGKTDIIVGRSAYYMDIYRNISENGVLAFDKPVTAQKSSYSMLFVEDIDGDGKPDLLVDGLIDNTRKYYPNTSQKGIISFAERMQNVPAVKYLQMRRADIDGDGKLDLIEGDPSTFYIHRNTGAGWGAYAPPVKLDATAVWDYRHYVLSDIDGDGKVDIAFPRNGHAMRVLKNISTPGTVAFMPPVDYDPATVLHAIVILDANNDGKPDMMGGPQGKPDLLVYTNKVQPEPHVESFSPVNAITGATITIKGSNFNNVSAVSFGGVPAASFAVQSPTLMTAVLGNGAAGKVAVTNNYGTGSKSGFTFGIPPVITTLVPARAPAGASITINGQNFSPVPANNLVYFGELKATVTAATTNALTVTVPQSAGHRHVSVTVNNLVARSPGMFSLTWPGGTDSFTAANFSIPVMLKTNSFPQFDFDGDGKIDLLNGVGLMHNTSTPGNISFAQAETVAHGASIYNMELGDMDGDGKPDMVIANYNSADISVLRNTSTPGTGSYSFVKEGSYPTSYFRQAEVLSLHDMDGDGKLDVFTRNSVSPDIFSILRNESLPGATALAPRVDYNLQSASYPQFADLDGDGLSEMIMTRYYTEQKVLIRRNTSVPGTISFDNDLALPGMQEVGGIAIADIDGDGKNDLILRGKNKTIELLMNQSSIGNISFRHETKAIDMNYNRIFISDLDGDSKIDINLIAEDFFGNSFFSLIKNTSSPGNASLKNPFTYQPLEETMPFSGSHTDVDGDGRPDIIIPVVGGHAYFRNITGLATVKYACAGAGTTLTAGLTGSTYQWQMNKGEGFVNLTENAQCKGVQTASLQLLNIPATWNYYEFRCVVNGNTYSLINKLDIPPTLEPRVSVRSDPYGRICEGTPVTFTALYENGGTTPVFQWKKNDISIVGANSTTYTAADLRNDDKITMVMTSSVACPSIPVATSSVIKMEVGSKTASITISGKTEVILGQSIPFPAVTLTNGGLNPSLRWQDSTNAQGWKNMSPSSSYSPTVDGAKLRCVLVSDEDCVPYPATFYSNVLTCKVVTALDPEPASSLGIRYYPNPVTTELRIEKLDLADKWESLSITAIEGMRGKVVSNIAGRSSITIDVSALSKGYYVVVLHRKQGPAVYLKFMKL